MRDELGRPDVRRQAIVLGHVADDLADRPSLCHGVQAQYLGAAAGWRKEPKEDLEKGALAGAVGSDQPDDSRLHRQVDLLQGLDLAVVFGQARSLDERHDSILTSPFRLDVII